MEFLFLQRLELLDQRRPDQAFLLGAVAALAGERTPGLPAIQRFRVDLVAIDDV